MIKPLGDRVVVKVVAEKEATQSGLILPGNKEKPQEGVVIAIGKGLMGEDDKRIPLDVAAGDRVLFGKYSGTEFKDGDETFLIIQQDDILGIL